MSTAKEANGVMQIKNGSCLKYCIEFKTRKNMNEAASIPESIGEKAEQRSLSQDELWRAPKERLFSPKNLDERQIQAVTFRSIIQEAKMDDFIKANRTSNDNKNKYTIEKINQNLSIKQRLPLMQIFVHYHMKGQQEVFNVPEDMTVENLLKDALKRVGLSPDTKVSLAHHSKIIQTDCYCTSILACGLQSNDTLTISGSMPGGSRRGSMAGGSMRGSMAGSMMAPDKEEGDNSMSQTGLEFSLLIKKEERKSALVSQPRSSQYRPQQIEQLKVGISPDNIWSSSTLNGDLDEECTDGDGAVEAMRLQLISSFSASLPESLSDNQIEGITEFLDVTGSNAEQRELFIQFMQSVNDQTLFTDEEQEDDGSPAYQQFENKLDKMIPKLDIEQTFQLIVALSPSVIDQKMAFLEPEQVQLLRLIKSSRSTIPIAYIFQALNASDQKTFKAFEHQLQRLLVLLTKVQLDDLLKVGTNPEQNAYLWRLLPAAQLEPFAFNGDQELVVNTNLLENCTQQQINELLELLSPKQKMMIELAQLKMSCLLNNEKPPITLQNILELEDKTQIDINAFEVGNEARVFRPGTEGEQLMVMKQFKGSVPCYTLQDDLSWSEVVDRTHSLCIYDLSADRKAWDKQTTTNLNLSGELYDNEAFLRIKPFSNDVAFLTKDDQNKKMYMNVIPERETQVIQTMIAPESLLHEYMLEDKLMQDFFRDKDQRDMIVFSKTSDSDEQIEDSRIFFYDVEIGRTIVRVNDHSSLLFMSVSEKKPFFIFDRYSCYIDLESARQASQPVLISPREDPSNGLKNQFTDYDYSNAREWKREGKLGFAYWNPRSFKMQMFEFLNKNEQKLLETKDMDHPYSLNFDRTLQAWQTGKSSDAKQRYDNNAQNERIETTHHLMITNKTTQDTLFVRSLKAAGEDKNFIGLTFPGQIYSFAVPGVMHGKSDNVTFEKLYQFTVLTEDRAQDEVHQVHVQFVKTFNKESQFLIENFEASKHQISDNWRDELFKVGDSRVSMKSYLLDGDWAAIRLQTESQIILLTNCVTDNFINSRISEHQQLRPALLVLAYADKWMYVVHEPKQKRDTVKLDDKDLFSISGVQIIQWCINNDIIHILDSNMTLTRLGIEVRDNNVELVLIKSTQLSFLDNIFPASELLEFDVALTETTLTCNGKVVSLETGRILFNQEGTKLTLQQNMLVCMNKGKLTISSDPGSRQLFLGDYMRHEQVKKFLQVSLNLLLLQLTLQDQEDWILMGTDGTLIDMPTELVQELKENCHTAQSYANIAGKCSLLLCYKNGIRLSKAKVLELTKTGSIASLVYLRLNLAEEEQEVVKDVIMVNQSGEMLQLRVQKFDEDNMSEPEFIKGRKNDKTDLICFEKANRSTQFAFAGNYFCWTNGKSVQIKNVKNPHDRKQISLSSLISEEQDLMPEQIKVNACEPLQLIEAGWSTQVNAQTMKKFVNYLQVSYQNTAGIYDLNPAEPTLFDKMSDMDELYDPENLVETGFKLSFQEEVKNKEEILFLSKPKTLSLSPMRNLVIEAFGEKNQRIFRKFNNNDIAVVKSLATEKPVIDISTFWAEFPVETTILSDEFYLYLPSNERAFSAMQAHHLDLKSNELEQETDQLTRRINYMLQKRTIEVNVAGKNNELRASSLLLSALDKPNFRKPLLKLGTLSPDFTVTRVFDNQDSFSRIVKHSSDLVVESLNNSFTQTKQMRQITSIPWPTGLKKFIHMSKSFDISKKELKELIREKMNDGQTHSTLVAPEKIDSTEESAWLDELVTVEVLDLRWFHKERKNFIGFSTNLERMPGSFVVQKFSQSLLDRFWPLAQKEMLWKSFIPYICVVLTSISYFHLMLQPEDEEPDADGISGDEEPVRQSTARDRTSNNLVKPDAEEDTTEILFKRIMGGLTVFLVLYSLWPEIKQFQLLKSRYFQQIQNWIDAAGLLLTLMITMLTMTEIEWISEEYLRMIASLASFFLMAKIYDWLNLFETTSFYVKLVELTISGIFEFMILFIVALITFGVPLSMLDLNSGENSKLINSFGGYWFLDAIINQYLLALGDFDSYTGESDNPMIKLILAFFLLATFFTQITMLNMLIAIMGERFSYAVDNKKLFGTSTMLELLVTQAPVLNQMENKDEDRVFMIVVSLQENEDDDKKDPAERTQTTIDNLSKDIKNVVKKSEQKLINAVRASQSSKNAALEAKVEGMQSQITSMDQKLDLLILASQK